MKRILILFVLLLFYVNLYSETGVNIINPGKFSLDKLSLTKNIKEFMLSNGLKVLIKEENSIPLAGFSVTYKVGFRNEDVDGKTGLTHLLEHMMFKGTKNYKKGEIARTFDDAGAVFNAYTTYDRTSYWEILPAGGLETAVKIEADRMVNSLFDPGEFKSEKKVVLSEINRYESNPDTILRRKLLGAVYKNHPYAYMYGKIEDVENADRDYVYNELYKKYYCPNNAYIVVVGNIKTDDAMALITKYFGDIAPNKNLPKSKANPLPFTTNISVTAEGVASENFGEELFNLPTWDVNNKDFIALDFISSAGIINGFDYQFTPDGGIGSIDFSEEPYYPADTVDTNFIIRNFSYFQNKTFNQEVLGYDTINSILNNLVHFERYGSYQDYEKLIKGFEQLTPLDVIGAIKKYLSKNNADAGYFKVKNRDVNFKPETISQTVENFGKDIDFSDLENPTREQIQKTRLIGEAIFTNASASLSNYLSDVKEEKLPNGITVIYKPFKLNQKVSISLGIKAPAYYQKTPYQHKLAYDFVFGGGPQIRLKNDLEASGAGFDGSSGLNQTSYNMDIPLEKFSEAIDCLGLTLKNRKFMPLVMEEMKFDYLKNLDEQKLNPDPYYQAETEMNKMLFGKKGYGLDFFVRKEDILKKNLKDAEDFYHSFYRPENTVIVVVGDINYDEVINTIKDKLGGWKQVKPVLTGEVPPLEKPAGNITKKISMPVRQSIVLMSAPSTSYSDITNHIALMIANNIFGGGGLTSRITRTIRDQYGLTYSIYTYIYPYGGNDIFTLGMQNAKKDIDRALALYQEELKNYKKTGPNELEIDKFRNKTLSDILFGYENSSAISSRLLYYKMNRNAYNVDELFVNILYKMDRDRILKALKDGIPDNYFISIASQ